MESCLFAGTSKVPWEHRGIHSGGSYDAGKVSPELHLESLGGFRSHRHEQMLGGVRGCGMVKDSGVKP